MAAAAFAPNSVLGAAMLAVAAMAASAAALSGLVAMQALSPPALRGPLGAIFLAVTSLVGFGVGPLVTGVLSELGGTAASTLAIALAQCVGAACAIGTALCLYGRGAVQGASRRLRPCEL